MLQKRGERDAARVHSGGVNAALVTADGGRAVTLSKDCTARVWDLSSGACIDVLVGASPWCCSALLTCMHASIKLGGTLGARYGRRGCVQLHARSFCLLYPNEKPFQQV